MASSILRSTFLALFTGALLAACGGGGGSGGGSGPATLTPSEPGTPGDTTPPGGNDGTTQPPGARSATVTWDSPTTRTDDSCLGQPASYRISYGLSPGTYKHDLTLDTADIGCTDSGATTACGKVLTCSYMVDELPTASWYFAVKAIDAAGNESDYSDEVVKTIQ